MPNVTVISYLFSLIFFGMGFSKMFVLSNPVTEHMNTVNYNTQVTLATSFFVLAIFTAVIGFLFFALRIIESKNLLKLCDVEFSGIEDHRKRKRLVEVNSIKSAM